MALNFSSISGNVNRAIGQANNLRSSVRSLTAPINQNLAQVNRLASQAGAFTGQMGAISNALGSVGDLGRSIGDLGRTVGSIGATVQGLTGITDKINSLSNRGGFDVNGLLGGIGDSISSIGGNLLQGNFSEAFGEITTGLSNTFNKITNGFSASDLGISPLGNLPVGDLNNLVNSFGDIRTFASNTINVLQRSEAELFGAIGGEFERLRQFEQDISNLDDFIDLNFRPPWSAELVSGQGVLPSSNSGRSASRMPNPLRDHNQFNYVISIGILSPGDSNNPDNYRSIGEFSNYIIRSGGGLLDQRYQTAAELEKGGHAEYFIEELTFDAVIAPNPNTGVALGTTLQFTVIEPYSMGNFIQAIIGSARVLGYKNYTAAPFCIKIDFVGWNEDGQTDANFIGQPMFFPIQFTKVDFSVTGKGSSYSVEAVAFSEVALSDEINQVKTNVNAVGDTVHTVLNGIDRSVTSTLNSRVEELENNEVIQSGDRYIIAFPRTKQQLLDVVRRGGTQPDSTQNVDAREQLRRRLGLSSVDELSQVDPGILNAVLQQVQVPAKSGLFQALDDFSKNISLMNDIGRSTIVENTAAGGDQAQGDQAQVHNEETQTNERNNAEIQTAEKSREHKFHQGESITGIIEKVIQQSQFGKENATTESKPDGTRRWFKIDTNVFLDSNPEAEAQLGRPPRIYVYSILPYYPDEAKFLGTTEKPQNTAGLMASALKEYNYIYTGKNEDIIDFNLEFNNAFLISAFANYGQNQGSVGSNAADVATLQNGNEVQGSQVNTNRSESDNSEAGAQVKEVVQMSDAPATGERTTDIRSAIAQQFHDRLINQVTDMITAEMTIMGDPFFIPQQSGNYTGNQTDNPNLCDDGTVNYMTNEVFIVVNFRTPLDYQVEGATMEFPQIVPQFSGLFSVWAVTNTFSRGKFTQTLKIIRRRGQDDEPTTNNTGPVTTNQQTTVATSPIVDTESNSGTSPAQSANSQANSSIGGVDPCATTVPLQSTGLVTVNPEEFLMSLPLIGNANGPNVAQISVGDFTYDPNTGIFATPGRVHTTSPTNNNSGPF